MKKIAVVGAGITGLTGAYRLQKLAHERRIPIQLDVYDAAPSPGGVIKTFHRDELLMEGGPDCFLSGKEKPWATDLCAELGLSSEIIRTNPDHRRSFIVHAGKLYPVPEGFYLMAPARLSSFLASPLMSLGGKLRVLSEPKVPKLELSDESLASFVRRRLGKELLERLAQPLIGGIYAADPEKLSLRATFPQFLEMEKTGGVLRGVRKRYRHQKDTAGARYDLLLSIKGGVQRIIDRLVQSLPPQSIHSQYSAQSLKRQGNQWTLRFSNGEEVTADGMLCALPAYVIAGLLETLPSELRYLREIPYRDAVTVNMTFHEQAIRHPLDGFGYVVPSVEKRDIFACTFVHKKFPGRAPKGIALLRAFAAGPYTQWVAQSDPELIGLAARDVTGLLGIREAPLYAAVERWPKAMPQFHVGHVERLAEVKKTLEGFPFLQATGNWDGGVGIPDCIFSGEKAATALMNQLAAS